MAKMLKRAKDVIVTEGTEGRNPFEVLMLVLAALSGLYVFSPQVPEDSAASHLPHWMVISWYILLCTGGLAGLVGVWQKNQTMALLVERVAMAWTGTSGIIFATILFTNQHETARQAGIGVLLFALASLWRLLRIWSFLRKVREQLNKVAKE